MMRKLRLGIAIAGVILLSAAPALAAQVDGPRFLSSDPEAGAELHDGAPERVEITFSEPLDASSEIKVVSECEEQIDDGSTAVSANTMQVGFESTPSGTYTVFYSAEGLGGVTGETTGSFEFLVHGGKSCDGGHGGGNHGGGHGEETGGGNHGGGEHGGDDEGGHQSGGDHEGGGQHEGGAHSGGSGHSGSGSAAHTGSGSHSGGSTHDPSRGSDHSSGTHASKGSDHGSNGGSKHGSKGGSKHASGHDTSGDAVKGNVLAAPGDGAAGNLLGQVEGSAVLMALGAALLMGAGGGWVIRTNNLF